MYNVTLIPDFTGTCCFLVLPLGSTSVAKLISTSAERLQAWKIQALFNKYDIKTDKQETEQG